MKSKSIKRAKHVACREEKKKCAEKFVWKPARMAPIGRRTRRQKYNVKTSFKKWDRNF
jgi:hypothetical protein